MCQLTWVKISLVGLLDKVITLGFLRQKGLRTTALGIFKYVLSTMGVSKESISKFLIGNRFHVKLRILSPYSKGLRMRNFTWTRFPIKNLLIDSLLTPIVESTYLNRDMCKFESTQKDESSWQSTDSSKAYRNISAFKHAHIVMLYFAFPWRATFETWDSDGI